jgi:hypothetical protein
MPAWSEAVSQAKAKLMANPQAVPQDLLFDDAAEAQAVLDGTPKPDMTPDAQTAAARLAALQLFQARKDAEAQRGTTGKDDANTFKGVADDLKNAAGHSGPMTS